VPFSGGFVWLCLLGLRNEGRDDYQFSNALDCFCLAQLLSLPWPAGTGGVQREAACIGEEVRSLLSRVRS